MAAVENAQLSWHIEVLGDVRVTCTQAAEPNPKTKVFTKFGKPAQALLAYLVRHLNSETMLSRVIIAEEFRPPPRFAEKSGRDKEAIPKNGEAVESGKGGQSLKVRKGGSEAERGDARFRQALSAISRALELGEDTARRDSFFTAGTGTLTLNRVSVTSDIIAFNKSCRAAEACKSEISKMQATDAFLVSQTRRARIDYLREAKRLYRGDFLPTFTEAWIKTQRLRLAEDCLDVLANLAQASLQENSQSQAQQDLDEYLEREGTFARKYGVRCREETRHVVNSLRNRLSFRNAVAEPKTSRKASGSEHLPLEVDLLIPLVQGFPRPGTHGESDPAFISHFVGREMDMEKLLSLLPRVGDLNTVRKEPKNQLVTIWGPPGYGKTRLAIEYANHRDVYSRYKNANGSILYVSLRGSSDDQGVAGQIAKAVAKSLKKTWDASPPLDFIQSRLSTKPVLLLLDDADYLTDEGREELTALLSQMPKMNCLIIAEKPLGLLDELTHEVLPLERPSPDDPPDKLRGNPCVKLLLAWANALMGPHRTLKLDEESKPIAELCVKLGGIPSAIEIVASWIPQFSLPDMLQRLAAAQMELDGWSAVSLLVSTYVGLDWMHFLKQIALLPGGWTIEAIQAILQEDLTPQFVSGLADHGLLKQVFPAMPELTSAHDPFQEVPEHFFLGNLPRRFDLPPPVRFFLTTVQPREAPRANQDNLRASHAAYFAGLAARLRKEALGSSQAFVLDALEQEVPHLNAALGWCLKDKKDIVLGLQMAGDLWEFWEQRNHWKKGIEWLKLARKEGAKTKDYAALARVGNGQATITMNYHQLDEAEKLAMQALIHARKLPSSTDNMRIVAQVLTSRAGIAKRKAEKDNEEHPSESALQVAGARRYYREAVRILKKLSMDTRSPLGPEALWLYIGLASVTKKFDGKSAEAVALYEEGLNIGLMYQDRGGMSHVLVGLADVSGGQGNTMPWIYLELCYRFRRELRQWGGLAECIEKLAYWSGRRGETERAYYLYGAARRLREDHDVARHEGKPESKEAYLARNREHIQQDPLYSGFHSVRDEQTEQLDWRFEQGFDALSDREAPLDKTLGKLLDWPLAGPVQRAGLHEKP